MSNLLAQRFHARFLVQRGKRLDKQRKSGNIESLLEQKKAQRLKIVLINASHRIKKDIGLSANSIEPSVTRTVQQAVEPDSAKTQ